MAINDNQSREEVISRLNYNYNWSVKNKSYIGKNEIKNAINENNLPFNDNYNRLN